MIDFIAHDFWSAVWLALLVVAGMATLTSGDRAARRILWCFAANWIGTRALVTFAHDSNIAWIALDAWTCVALVTYGRSKPAYAVAVLFAVILALDNLTALGIADFSSAAAGSDLLGFIGLILMAGAGYVDGGKANRSGFGNLGGRWGADSHASSWRPISPRAGSVGQDMGGGQKVVR